MRPANAGALLSLSLIALACVSPGTPSPKDAFPSLDTFQGLGKVQLGLTVDQLRERRPGVRYAPQRGMQEVVGEDTIIYLYEGALSDDPNATTGTGTSIPRMNPMNEIETWRTVPSEFEAQVFWTARVRDLRKVGKPSCLTIEIPEFGPQRIVALRSDEGLWYVSRLTGPIMRLQPPTTEWRVWTTVGRRGPGTRLRPDQQASAVCPD
jgi:hypothetical protein